MGNQIDLLIHLQEIDGQLRERTEAIGALRMGMQDIEARLASERGALETCRHERAPLETRRREIESLLADEESKMKDRRMRLNRIRNEKEAAAIRREIEVAKEEGQRVEEELLGEQGLYNVLKTLGERETELRAAIDALDSQRAAEQARVDGEIAKLSDGLSEAQAQREQVASGLETTLRRRYETVFEKRRGLAVVEVRGGSCEGCHMSIAPQLVNEIQRNQQVIACPSCHRILYLRATSADADAEA